MDLIGDSESYQIEITAAQTKSEVCRGSGVGHGISEWHFGRDCLSGGLGRDLLVRDDQNSFQAFRGLDTGGYQIVPGAGTDYESTANRSSNVIRMPFQFSGSLKHLLTLNSEFIHVISCHETRDYCRSARPHAPRKRDVAADPETQAIRGMESLESPDHKVVSTGRDFKFTFNRELPGLRNFEFKPDVQCDRHYVIARTKIG